MQRTSRALSSDIQNSRAISGAILHDSRSTATIMSSPLVGVRTIRGRPAFTRGVGVTLASP
jgi:hypothetical protein